MNWNSSVKAFLAAFFIALSSTRVQVFSRHHMSPTVQGRDSKTNTQPPFDTILYDELNVSYFSETHQIQRAFRRIAIECHPDKNPGDAVAEERFKRVNEAYAILSNKDTREEYDKKGYYATMEDGPSHQPEDPMEIFREYFGGGRFDHLVGELPHGPWDWERESKDGDMFFYRSRRLADHLLSMLQHYIIGQWETLDRLGWEEVNKQSQEEMGPDVLKLVGKIYVDYGQKNLGLYHAGMFTKERVIARLKDFGERSGVALNLLVAASSTANVLLRNSLGTNKQDEWTGHKAKTPLVKALWHLSVINIEKTVRQACRMLLKDPNVAPSERRLRAEALIRLGQIYLQIQKVC